MSKYYQAIPVAKGIYHIGSRENVFVDLFVGAERALLFDTGYGFDDLRKFVRAMTALPLIVVNSHGHPDHGCGDWRFPGPIHIHEKDRELCRRFNEPRRRRMFAIRARATKDYVNETTADILPALFDADAYAAGRELDLVPVREGQAFDLGGMQLEVVELPGHTGGCIGLLNRKERLLFSGDALGPFMWLFAPEATRLDAYLTMLGKAKALDFDRFLAGHGPAPRPKSDIDLYRECAERVDEAVYASGVPFQSDFDDMNEGSSDPRICQRPGYGPMDFAKPGFAAIVIGRDKL